MWEPGTHLLKVGVVALPLRPQLYSDVLCTKGERASAQMKYFK